MDGAGNPINAVDQQIIIQGGVAIAMDEHGRQQIQPPPQQQQVVRQAQNQAALQQLQQAQQQLQQQAARQWNVQHPNRMYPGPPGLPPLPAMHRDEHRRMQPVNFGQIHYNQHMQAMHHQPRVVNQRPQMPQGYNHHGVLVYPPPPPPDMDPRDGMGPFDERQEPDLEEQRLLEERIPTMRRHLASVLLRMQTAADELNGSPRQARIIGDIRALEALYVKCFGRAPEDYVNGMDNRDMQPPPDNLTSEIEKIVDEMFRNGLFDLDLSGGPITRKLAEILRCGVCFLPIRRPQTLVCGHTVCGMCMENMVKMTAQRDAAQNPFHGMGLRVDDMGNMVNFGGAAGQMHMMMNQMQQQHQRQNGRPQGNAGGGSTTILCPVCRRPCNVPQGGISISYTLQDIIDALLRTQAECKLKPGQQYRKCCECKLQMNCSYYFSCEGCSRKQRNSQADGAMEDGDTRESADTPQPEMNYKVLCAACTVRSHNGHEIVEHASLTKEIIEGSKKKLAVDYDAATKLVEEGTDMLAPLIGSARDKYIKLLGNSLSNMKKLTATLDSKEVANWNRAQLTKNEDLSGEYLRGFQEIVTTKIPSAIETQRKATEAMLSDISATEKDMNEKVDNCRTPDMSDCIQIESGPRRPKEPKIEKIDVKLEEEEAEEDDIIVENVIAANPFPLEEDPADYFGMLEPPFPQVMDAAEAYNEEFAAEEREINELLAVENRAAAEMAYRNFAGYYINDDEEADRPGPSGINNNGNGPRLRNRPPRAAVFSPTPETSRRRKREHS